MNLYFWSIFKFNANTVLLSWADTTDFFTFIKLCSEFLSLAVYPFSSIIFWGGQIPFSFFSSLACLTEYSLTLKNSTVLETDQSSGTYVSNCTVSSSSLYVIFSLIRCTNLLQLLQRSALSAKRGSASAVETAWLNLVVTFLIFLLPSATVQSEWTTFKGEHSNVSSHSLTRLCAVSVDRFSISMFSLSLSDSWFSFSTLIFSASNLFLHR